MILSMLVYERHVLDLLLKGIINHFEAVNTKQIALSHLHIIAQLLAGI